MPRIAILHMIVGFSAIFLSASGGAFIATDTAEAFVRDKQILDTWGYLILKSAHGHTSLFGQLHILFGLTCVYTKLTSRMKIVEFAFLCCGTLSMSLLMLLRAWSGPSLSTDPIGLITGLGLTLALIALIMKIFGLIQKFLRTEHAR